MWVKCREITRLGAILELFLLLSLEIQVEEEMAFFRKKEVLYRR